MSTAELVLAYLQALLTGPVVFGGITVAFMLRFRANLAGLIDRIGRIKLPGGAELQTTQQTRLPEQSSTDVQVTVDSAVVPAEGTQLTAAMAKRIVDALQAEKANAYLWEYRYLNQYLVRSTQMVLEWLAGLPGATTTRLVDTHLQAFIFEANERQAIIGALASHHLIDIKGEMIEVTPKGREYLAWRGPLPSLPVAAN